MKKSKTGLAIPVDRVVIFDGILYVAYLGKGFSVEQIKTRLQDGPVVVFNNTYFDFAFEPKIKFIIMDRQLGTYIMFRVTRGETGSDTTFEAKLIVEEDDEGDSLASAEPEQTAVAKAGIYLIAKTGE